MQNGSIEKEEVESQEPPCERECNKVAAPYLVLFSFMYKVQLYTEDWIFLHMLGCKAIALPNT